MYRRLFTNFLLIFSFRLHVAEFAHFLHFKLHVLAKKNQHIFDTNYFLFHKILFRFFLHYTTCTYVHHTHQAILINTSPMTIHPTPNIIPTVNLSFNTITPSAAPKHTETSRKAVTYDDGDIVKTYSTIK